MRSLRKIKVNPCGRTPLPGNLVCLDREVVHVSSNAVCSVTGHCLSDQEFILFK